MSGSKHVSFAIIQLSSSHVKSIGCERGGKLSSQEASGRQVSGGNGGNGGLLDILEEDVTIQADWLLKALWTASRCSRPGDDDAEV
jgi:hypothetical protein